MTDWDEKSKELPEDINEFDWRNFQQEYRDYIDLAKMAQLIPLIGAPVGIVVNNRLLKKIGCDRYECIPDAIDKMRLLTLLGRPTATNNN
jgi:hypothetical protein